MKQKGMKVKVVPVKYKEVKVDCHDGKDENQGSKWEGRDGRGQDESGEVESGREGESAEGESGEGHADRAY